jgi:hypothetical protein
VPNVIGRSYGEAKAILEAKGYRVAQRTTDSAAPKGIVVNQSPRGNALPGFVITLYVSNGSVQVPPPTPPGQGGDPGNGGGGGGGGGPGPPGGGGTPGTFGYGPIRGFGF